MQNPEIAKKILATEAHCDQALAAFDEFIATYAAVRKLSVRDAIKAIEEKGKLSLAVAEASDAIDGVDSLLLKCAILSATATAGLRHVRILNEG